jgi:serine/threonine-protein kinase
VLIRPEPSDTIEKGRVTRTDPEKDTELTKGQTVYLWVSSGPDVETAKVPNVLGRDVEMAINLLKAAGFNNIETNEVESDKAKGVVVSQSEEKNTDVDVTTTITWNTAPVRRWKWCRCPMCWARICPLPSVF